MELIIIEVGRRHQMRSGRQFVESSNAQLVIIRGRFPAEAGGRRAQGGDMIETKSRRSEMSQQIQGHVARWWWDEGGKRSAAHDVRISGDITRPVRPRGSSQDPTEIQHFHN